MEGWPRIPHPGGGSGKAPRTTAASLPAPGSTVVANVEDELGDGMYSLRWAGQKIHVSSRSPLAKGQALLLKSETSPEGKPRLVVLGPAPEQAAPSGRIIYGPNVGKKQLAEQLAHQQAAVQQQAQQQSRNAGLAHSRIGGNIVDTGGRAVQPDADAPAGQAGGQMAAGVSKAVTARAGEPTPGLIGLVLEPLPDFDRSAKRLLEAAKEEKGLLEEQQTAGAEAESSETTGEENSSEEAKINRKDLPRPAATGQTGQAQPQQPAAAAPAQAQPGSPPPAVPQPPHAENARPAPVIVQDGGSAVPELPDVPTAAPGGKTTPAQQPQHSGTPPPSAPPQQPLASPGTPAPAPGASASAPQPSASGTPQQTPSPPQAQPNSSTATASGQPAASAPAGQPPFPPPSAPAAPSPLPGTPLPSPAASGQTAVPSDQPGASASASAGQPPVAPGQSAARPDAQPAPVPQPLPGTPSPQMPVPGQPANPSGQPPGAPTPGQPPVPPAPPGQSGGQTAPQPLPETPATPAPQPAAPTSPAPPSVPGASLPDTAQPNAPAPSTPTPSPLPGRPAASTPQPAPAPVAPGQPPAAPAQPVPPSGQQPAVPGAGQPSVPPGSPGGQAAPQPLPGTVVFEDGGAVVPDVPVDGDFSQPQTRPAAPGTSPPAAAQPNAPATPTPPPAMPLPGTPAPAPVTPAPQPPAPKTPVPQTPTPPPTPAYPGTHPRPGTATYLRPTPQQSYAHSVTATASAAPGTAETNAPENANAANPATPANAAAAPSPQIKPEMLLREALGQMVGAAEIPLGNPATDATRLAPGNKMPEAVLDKAAAILLRGAGLTPDPETMEAAKALVANNVPVDRDGVQALLAAAAGIEDPGEREAALRAAARLLSKDIPLSPPLVAGMTDVVSRRATAHQLMDAAAQALAPDAALSMTAPEAEPLMAGARELLDMLHVDLGRADAPAALERALSTFGREALGQALALIETSAQAVLENNPQLQKIDQALTAILSRLQPEMEQTAPPPQASPPPPQTPSVVVPQIPQADSADLLPPASAPLPSPPEAPAAAPVQPQTSTQTPPAQQPAPPPPHASRPINAYLNAPKALPIEEMLKKLPPMPKVVSLGTPAAIPSVPPMMLPGHIANMANLANLAGGAQPAAPALPPSTAQQILAQTLPQILPQMQGAQPQIPSVPGAAPGTDETPETQAPEPLDPEQIFRQAEALRRQSGVMNKLGSLFQIPGLNRQELELLRPGGFLDTFLNSDSAAGRPDAAQTKADAERLLRDLMSPDARTAERALRELPQKESSVLRETAARLTRMESDAVRADPLMNKLSDAATSLRDLGRQLLAVKAENLAGQDRNPGVMLAEVPFKLNDDAGDGRMQMFYRRGKKKGDGWSSRVILDLNTTRMGPVLGDMRFFGQDMTLNMFVDKQEAADYLSVSAEELAENLSAKGFRVKMKFMVLPPPPPPPTLDGERPAITGEEPQSVEVRRTPGRLDIEL